MLLKIIKNKYFITLAAFVILMLFFDRNDIFIQAERKAELKNLLAGKHFYEQEIQKTKQQLADLQNNPAALEKYARENFYMKRSNEDVFILEPPVENHKD